MGRCEKYDILLLQNIAITTKKQMHTLYSDIESLLL